ncbi:hypothetical protein F5Y09DRAFT_321954 [Xylaria sp. FL1042]|nr:hypothetical protein F5Y09DRAFT_321954 [Xylaria sp. FL1042]
MSPPSPLPSKAAIRALHSIALGTSCAIGVIVEDRRRRLNTLKIAVANKQKLQSSRQYHNSSLEKLPLPLDGATLDNSNLQLHEREGHGLRKHRNVKTTDPENALLEDLETQDPFQDDNNNSHIQQPQPSPSESSPPQATVSQEPLFVAIRRLRTSLASQSASDSPISMNIQSLQPQPASTAHQTRNALILEFGDLVASTDKQKLGQALSLFLSNASTIPSSPEREGWLKLSAHLSLKFQRNRRWEDASRILTTVIGLGPLNEDQYFAYDPLPIIEFHLLRSGSETPCSPEGVTSAAKLYLAKLEEKREGGGTQMELIGRRLMMEALSSQRFNLALHVYWRMLGWAASSEMCAGWAIRTFFRHSDYKAVLKIFLLHYSRLRPGWDYFDPTMNMVIRSVEAMKGLNANSILEALAQMHIPKAGKLHSRWIMQVLRAHWDRHQNISKTKKIFEKAVSLGIMDKISHPEGVYRTLIEIAIKAGDPGMAYSYADKVVHDYPHMKDDIALKLAVLKAEAGEWDNVLTTFRQVQASMLPEPIAYDNACILVLQVFAGSHSAAETRDFTMLFVRDMSVGFHPHMVTLVAKKYGQARDMKGFMAWLELCSEEGFALDAGFCNSVLYNCWAKWKITFPELRMLHAKFQALNPHCSDAVTQRILSQAAQSTRSGLINIRPGKMITVNKLAYLGRSTNKRDIFEAMNQELMQGKPGSAVAVYKRAMHFGMPFCSHCLRLAVLAALQAKDFGSDDALSFIQDAHAQGHDVGPAVSTFIKRQLDAFRGSAWDAVTYMRNLISDFESSQITISPAVLTHMATICVKIGHHEKAISLCHLAQDRSGSSHLCFSSQSFRALATAYSELFDVDAMNSLVDSMCESEYSADKAILLHLKSIRRLVKKKDASSTTTALLEVIERGIQHLTRTRAEVRTQGKLISQETLQLVGNALLDVETKVASRLESQKSRWEYKGKLVVPMDGGLVRRVGAGVRI